MQSSHFAAKIGPASLPASLNEVHIDFVDRNRVSIVARQILSRAWSYLEDWLIASGRSISIHRLECYYD